MYSPLKYVFVGRRVFSFMPLSRVTEDVVHNREERVRFFISNIFEMAYIHYIA